MLTNGLCAVIILNFGAPCRYMANLFLAQAIACASFSVWLYLFSVAVIVLLMQCTGFRLSGVFWSNAADNPSWKLASVLTTISRDGLKYDKVFSSVIASFNFSKASCSTSVHFNFVSFSVRHLNGAVMVEYLGMNFDRYPSLQGNFLLLSWSSTFFNGPNFLCCWFQPILCKLVPIEFQCCLLQIHIYLC